MKIFHIKMSRVVRTAMAVALFGGLTMSAQADEGVARIADAASAGEPQLLSFEGQPVDGGVYYEGAYGCPNGECYGGCEEGGCAKDGCFNMYPADAGWGRPIRNYIEHVPVSYLKRWPDRVHGIHHPGPMKMYPIVYQPTDTTQLGFTYQRVPTWQPKPWMVPPMPIPSQWHRREAGYRTYSYGYGDGYYHGGHGGYYPGSGEYCPNCPQGGGVIYESPSPSTEPTVVPGKTAPTEVPPAPQVRRSVPDRLLPAAY
ncbi:MAG: hypothetical protein CMJ46_16455 [Planctomyces sp.]|nr:hypothetical protein [Planctomyces sp.]